MPDLRWTMPVASWSATAAAPVDRRDISFIEPIVRRRLSSLSRSALKVAHDCVAGRDARARGVRVAAWRTAAHDGHPARHQRGRTGFADRVQPVGPQCDDRRVRHRTRRPFARQRNFRRAPKRSGYALLEAHAQFAADPSSPVLMVYADEPADAAYGTIEDEVQGGALAILLDAQAVRGSLRAQYRVRGRLSEDPSQTITGNNFRTQTFPHAERGGTALPRHAGARRMAKRRH